MNTVTIYCIMEVMGKTMIDIGCFFMTRRDKHNYYLDIAEAVLQRGTCLRRNYGSVIVKNDEIIATGYSVHLAEEKLPGYGLLHQGENEYPQGSDVRIMPVCTQRGQCHYFRIPS